MMDRLRTSPRRRDVGMRGVPTGTEPAIGWGPSLELVDGLLDTVDRAQITFPCNP